jgi:AcrR family transcriptional regulator
MAMRPHPRSRDHTRTRILDAATELFGRDGFDKTTVRAIARCCGITDAALYYHFPSKRAILTSLWDTSPLDADNYDPGHPARLTYETLDAIVDRLADESGRKDALSRLLIRSVLSGDQTAHALRESMRAFLRVVLLPRLETVFDTEEAAIRTDAVMMLCVGFFYTAQIEQGSHFAEACETAEFRARLKRMVRLLVPLPPEER